MEIPFTLEQFPRMPCSISIKSSEGKSPSQDTGNKNTRSNAQLSHLVFVVDGMGSGFLFFFFMIKKTFLIRHL